MPLFETRLTSKEYFALFFGCYFLFIPVAIIHFFAKNQDDLSYIYFTEVFFFLFGSIYPFIILKHFQLYEDCFVVRKPQHWWKPEVAFPKNEIEKIEFWQSKNFYLTVQTKEKRENYMIVNSYKTIKVLVAELEKAGIKTVVKFTIK